MSRFRIPGLILAVILVIAVAGMTRWKAVTTLGIDYDEDDYLRAAQEYTAVIRSGDFAKILDTNYRSEHPVFAKIIMGLALLSEPEKPLTPGNPTSAQPNQYLARDLLRTDRLTNAVFGVITAGLLAIVNPLGGLLLGIHAWTIKYVSQIMLEAIPAFTSLVTVLAYLMWKKKGIRRLNFWLILSAVFLGMTAASKYIYCIVGVAILADWLIDAQDTFGWKSALRTIAIWGLISVAMFFVFNPYLWPDPVGRLRDSILYHSTYATTASEVEGANFPIWQQLVWLSRSPRMWQADAFYFSIDPLIAILAFIGIGGTWRKQRVFALWLVIGFAFLLVWPTKWPQYLITLTVPLCYSASEGLKTLVIQPIQLWIGNLRTRKVALEPQKSDLKTAIPWLIPGILVFVIFTILPLLYQMGVSLTDFNSISIKDGLTGGIWREVWGGISGKIDVAMQEFPYRAKEVHYLGLANFEPLFDYLLEAQILVRNIIWTVTSVLLQTTLGLIAGLLLFQNGLKLKRMWQSLFILPWAIPEFIGAIMWVNIFAPTTGWLALAAQKFGPDIPFSFLLGWENSPDKWLLILLISGVWYGFPFMMLATSASMKMIPKESFDAAQIDGADALQTFFYITLPLIYPLLVPAIIIRSIFAFNQFYLFQAFGIGDGTLATMSFNFFNPSGFFINGQFAISAVLNIITVLILVIFVILFNRASKADQGVTYA
ncbi:MAG TPA: sugar ABC transporter permease [Bellilinea sp.]